MSVAVQAAVLTVIGVIIHLVGVALYFIAKRREGLLLTLLGGLWTLAMVIFYIYSTLGFYGAVGLRAESPGPAVTTTLGFIILIIGIIVAVRLARRGGVM